ncbi:MAG: cold shock domain-containing protein [Bacteroidetes bacterium]|nr:cold shock domain-containing protein [Bacteroidota bacterium]
MEIYEEIEYGFIKPIKGKDLFVHKNDIVSDTGSFNEGLLVTFEVYYDEKKDKYKAIKVKRINDEENVDLVKRLAFHESSDFWIQAFPAYLDRIDFEDATKLLYKNLDRIDYLPTKKSLISNLSNKFLTHFAELRTMLPDWKRFNVCLYMLKSIEMDEYKKEEIIGEALDSLKSRGILRDFDIQKIPKDYLLAKRNLREKLNDSEYFNICLEILEEKINSHYDYTEILDELKDFLSIEGKKHFWNELPEVLFVSNPDLRKNIFFGKRFEVCKNIIKKQLTIGEVDKNIVREAIESINESLSFNKESYWEQLPTKSYVSDSEFRSQMPIVMFMKLLLNNYKKANDRDREKYLNEIKTKLENSIAENDSSFDLETAINLLPKELLFNRNIFESLTPRIQIEKLIEANEILNEETVKSIHSILLKTTHETKEYLLKIIPIEIFLEERSLFRLLSPVKQVEIMHLNESDIDNFWPELNCKAKIYLIYRCLKESGNFDITHEKDNVENPLVTLLLLMLEAIKNPSQKTELFETFHLKFQDYVVEKAWNLNENIDLSPLLPSCEPTIVQYCEARPWPTSEDRSEGQGRISRAFCPREKKECSFYSNYSYGLSGRFGSRHLSGARLKPDINLSWNEWSLLEVLEIAKIIPKVKDLKNSIEYVPRLSGWVNRLNEIRERLKCSICSKPLIPNQKYAKHLARYNSTVAYCSEGKPHDHNIYFNHCWACREIIDSRESNIKIENFYLCIHCGSGPQQSLTYRQGTICPCCGGKNIKNIDDREQACNDCNHNFILPAKQYLTGFNY